MHTFNQKEVLLSVPAIMAQKGNLLFWGNSEGQQEAP